MTPHTVEILMAEDNPGDVRLMLEALRQYKVRNQLHVVEDGEAALAFLRREAPFPQAPRPDLILLDLNMPRKGGLEVLASIKADPNLRRIPVVILTSSGAERDVVSSYDQHANCYIVKPLDLEQFIEVVERIEGFWLEIVKLP